MWSPVHKITIIYNHVSVEKPGVLLLKSNVEYHKFGIPNLLWGVKYSQDHPGKSVLPLMYDPWVATA